MAQDYVILDGVKGKGRCPGVSYGSKVNMGGLS